MATSRRAISLVVASILMLQSFHLEAKAAGIGDLIPDYYSNSTSAGTWTNPVNSATYLYGGSYEFRFKNQGNTMPWFNGEGPSFKIGCHGMSLRGGFLQLLGLDEIKLQLVDAGTTLAWGVLLGLEITMPSLAQVFAKIRAWAHQIQSLLQNQCNMGRLIGQSIKNGIGKDIADAASESALGQSFSAIKNDVESFAGKVDRALGMVNDTNNDSTKKPNLTTAMRDILDEKLAAYSSPTCTAITSTMNPNTTAKLAKSALSDTFYSGKIGNVSITPDPNSAAYTARVAQSKLMLIFFGDIGLGKQGVDDIEQYYLSDGNIDADKLKSAIKRTLTGESARINDGLEFIPPVISNAKEAATALMRGFSYVPGVCKINGNGSISVTGSTPTCQIPNYNIYLIGSKSYMVSGASDVSTATAAAADGASATVLTPITSDATVKTKVFLAATPPDNSTYIQATWDGFYESSLRGVTYLVEKQKGSRSATLSSSDDATPMLLPNIVKYAKLIANEERKNNGSSNSMTINLKNLLARKNAYFSAINLAEQAQASALQMLVNSKLETKSEGYKTLMNFLRLVEARKREILSAINEDAKNDDDQEKIVALFKELEMSQQSEANRKLGGVK